MVRNYVESEQRVTVNYNILVAEDDPASALSLRDTLRQMGHTVTGIAATGDEALQHFRNQRPDLVLMDIALSGSMTGVEAADSIRRTQDIPVLFVSAHSDAATLSQAYRAEPYGLILKPFDEDILRIAVEVAIHRHRADVRLRENERRLLATLQAMGDAVISVDDRRVVNFVNVAAEAFTGSSSHSACGEPLDSLLTLIHPTSREPLTLDRESRGEAILVNRAGREVPVVFSMATIPTGSGQVLVISDITAIQRLAEPKAVRPQPGGLETRARVFLVEAHPITRHGIEQLLASQRDMEVCGWVGDAASALRAIEAVQPDLAIVDLSTNGLEVVKAIRATHPRTRVLVLSTYDESVYAQRALRAGARGYIMKGEAPDKLVSAVRRVLAGEVYLSERESIRALEALSNPVQHAAASPIELLSNRELEVFRWIGLGSSLREIAGKLHLSVKTVETHCAHIKVKLNIANARELVRQAVLWIEDSNNAPSSADIPSSEVRIPPG